ncbi:type II toxin-antitoxin system RelE/ParE family toxin [Desulfonema magnum]|uniref:Toxin-antitoxin system, toxin component, HigB-like n=1 Tax=Desulfonema magnum TaxID=45655 RepID=A0A975BXC0_9BACT|nr:type II toxin-antitoxin system RelE/ParE family toxin [Desulfonema magnum]QTA93443.1 Toxin-antitoxin system, toxin component, HigB-like [Desulfonema magnum]
MNWEIYYYNEKVQNEIDSWPVSIRAVYARITERIIVFGPNLGLPLTRSMGDGLFEIRAKGREGIGRAFFCTVIGSKVIILHSFIKKSQKTPVNELRIARKRMKEVS